MNYFMAKSWTKSGTRASKAGSTGEDHTTKPVTESVSTRGCDGNGCKAEADSRK